MPDDPHTGRDPCSKCGRGDLRLVVGRIAKAETPGHMNMFQCAACGQIDWRDIPHQPPGKESRSPTCDFVSGRGQEWADRAGNARAKLKGGGFIFGLGRPCPERTTRCDGSRTEVYGMWIYAIAMEVRGDSQPSLGVARSFSSRPCFPRVG